MAFIGNVPWRDPKTGELASRNLAARRGSAFWREQLASVQEEFGESDATSLQEEFDESDATVAYWHAQRKKLELGAFARRHNLTRTRG